MTQSVIIFMRICVIFSIICNFNVFGQGPVVNTTLGQVRGVFADDGNYTMFLGIPFGKVNEDNPFGVALPHPVYDGIFEANNDSAICPQRGEFDNILKGTLDCLHLSVHVPNTASTTNLRPVYVWIHGGGFIHGDFGRYLYGPKFLVRHDIVLVTLNYRLGVYGFMCLDIPEVSGNQGLKDQLLALRWIRDNIANFGGDPDNITIGGNSAGSIATEYHLMRKNDGSKLFHKAILQSGTAFIFAPVRPVYDTPIQIAYQLGFETNDVYEALDFLAKVDPLLVIEKSLELNLGSEACLEKEFENVEVFLTENINNMTELTEVRDIPIMIGFTNDELYMLAHGGFTEVDILTILGYMLTVLDWQHPDFNFMIDNIYKFYLGDEELNYDQVQNIVDFMGDLAVVYPTIQSIKRFMDSDAGNIYLYIFSYSGGRNFMKQMLNATEGGAYHADEYGYMFDISYMDEPSGDDEVVLDAMTAMWANFVKYGDPTPQTSELLPHKWGAITKDSPFRYIEIDRELRVGTSPLRERLTYWKFFFDHYGRPVNSVLNGTNSEAYHFLKKVLVSG